MKKLFLIFSIIVFLSSPSLAIAGAKEATSLTGGDTGALDAFDGATLNDGDIAFVSSRGALFVYKLDADSGASETPPFVISPDSRAGNKRWMLQNNNGVIYPEWWGADGSGDDRTPIQACITAAPPNSTIIFNDDYTVGGKLQILNKKDLVISGKGSIVLSTGAGTPVTLFDLVGRVDNFTIENLELVGENQVKYYGTAIGNNSGQTLSNITIRNLKLSNFNVGISANANLSGSATKYKIYGNEISNIVGTGPGQGYGIHIAKATQCSVFGNTLTGCQRHSIYQGAGIPSYNIISGNTIVDHRETGHSGAFVAAISISRSSHVQVLNNQIINFYDGGIIIDPSSYETVNCTHIEIRGNKLIGRKNGIPGIIVGEQAVPTSYFSQHIDIVENRIHTDWTTTTSEDIRIMNGKNIQVRDNTIIGENIARGHAIVTVGTSVYIGAATDIDYIEVKRNRFDLSGRDLTTIIPIYVDTDVVATYPSHIEIEGNTINGVRPGSREITYGTTPANPNMRSVGMSASYVMGSGAGCAAGTSAGKAKTTANINLMSGDWILTKKATDDLWTIGAAANTGVGEYRKVLLCLDNAGGARYVVGTVSAVSQADAPVPKLPHHQWAPVGIVEINASWTAGDALTGKFYDLVGIYGK